MMHSPNSEIDMKERSPLALAFVGDGVLELLVRARLVANSRLPVGALHRLAVQMVSAKGQSAALVALEGKLTEQEKDMMRRGRNANKTSVSKNASAQEYRASTGLEALFGWLYMQQMMERIEELFELIWAWSTPESGNQVGV